MDDHIVVTVDPLVIPASLQSLHHANAQLSSNEGSSSRNGDMHTSAVHVVEVGGSETLDEEHLFQKVECRICQDEDSLDNLDVPCACRGTLKFAHRRCVQLWCIEKGDTICEICHQPYKPGYSPYHPEVTSNYIRDGRTISRTPLDLHDPQILAIAALQRHVLQDEQDDIYSSTKEIRFCRFVSLILITLLLLRHAASLFNTDVEKALTYLSLSLFRAVAFVLPCYLMARSIRIIQNRRQRQQAAAQLAFMLQAEQYRGLQFATSPVPVLR